jgi:hypothetical protein
MHDRGLHLGDFPPSPKRVKAFWLDLTFAGQDRSEERYSGRVHMIQRQRIVDAILAGAQPDSARAL